MGKVVKKRKIKTDCAKRTQLESRAHHCSYPSALLSSPLFSFSPSPGTAYYGPLFYSALNRLGLREQLLVRC